MKIAITVVCVVLLGLIGWRLERELPECSQSIPALCRLKPETICPQRYELMDAFDRCNGTPSVADACDRIVTAPDGCLQRRLHELTTAPTAPDFHMDFGKRYECRFSEDAAWCGEVSL